MGDLEALGDCGDRRNAGARGRAGRRRSRPRRPHPRANCLNCGAPLAGPYCARLRPACARPPVTCAPSSAISCTACSISKARFWRTLPMLAWRPGKLTRRYIDGQRARFVSPIALFLFSVFLLFATIQLIGGPSGIEPAHRRWSRLIIPLTRPSPVKRPRSRGLRRSGPRPMPTDVEINRPARSPTSAKSLATLRAVQARRRGQRRPCRHERQCRRAQQRTDGQ